MLGSNILHGAAVLCYINGILIGRITDFDYDYSVGIEDINGLDFPMPFELAETRIMITGHMQLLRLSGDGGSQGMGLMPQVHEFGRLKYSTIMILDRKTGRPFFKSDFCRVTSEHWGIPNKGLVTGSVSFKAIAFNNEMASSDITF